MAWEGSVLGILKTILLCGYQIVEDLLFYVFDVGCRVCRFEVACVRLRLGPELLLKINFANPNPRTLLVQPKFANPGAKTLRSCALVRNVLDILLTHLVR